MNDFPERMKYLLDYLGIGPSELADRLGIQRSGISHLLSGRNKPGMDFLEKLALHYPGISLEWFITGKGTVQKTSGLLPVQEEQPVHRDLFTTEPENQEKNTGKIQPQVAEVKDETSIPYTAQLQHSSKSRVRKVILLYDNGTAEVHEVSAILSST